MSFIMRPIRFASTGHIIEGSGLFDGTSGRLTKAYGTGSTDLKTYTLHVIAKLNDTSGTTNLFSAWNSNTQQFTIDIANGVLSFYNYSTAYDWNLITTQLFRDFSGYIELDFVVDTSNATSGDRIKIYANGVRITSFTTATYPSLNSVASHWGEVTIDHTILAAKSSGAFSQWMDAYASRIVYIDGLALDPTSFGEVTGDGFWSISDVSELTFGNNGFLLEGQNVATGVATGGSLSQATSYTNTDGSGNRTSTITASSNVTPDSGTVNNWVDGGVVQNSSDSIEYTGAIAQGDFFRFQFSSNRFIDEITLINTGSESSLGNWKVQGSTDASTWDDLASFVYSNNGGQTISLSNVDAGGYSYYQLIENDTSQTYAGQWYAEIKFKIAETVGAVFTKTGTITTTNDSPTNDADDGYGNYSTIDPLNTRTTTNTHVASQALTNGNRTTAITVADAHQAYTQTLSPGGKYHVEQTCGTWGSDANGGHAIMILCPKSKWEGSTTGPAVVTSAFAFHARKPGGGGFGPITRLSGSNLTTLGTEVANGNRVTYDIDMSTIGSTTVKISIEGSLISTDSSMAFADEEYVMAFNVDNVARSIDFTMNTGSDAFVDTPVTGHVAVSTATQSTPDVINYEDEYYIEAGISHSNGSTTAVTLPTSVSGGAVMRLKRTDSTGSWYVATSENPNDFWLWDSLADKNTSSWSNAAASAKTWTLPSALATGTYLIEIWYQGDYFQWVEYTGNQTNRTISWDATMNTPGMSAVLGSASHNPAWHNSLTSDAHVIYTEATSAQASSATVFNSTAPTATAISLGSGGNGNQNGKALIGMAWANSGPYAFGSMEGNANANGPVISINGSPQAMFVKNIDNANGWVVKSRIFDTGGNPLSDYLYFQQTAAVATFTSSDVDELSTGFKMRGTHDESNGSYTYVYGAFGIQPLTDGAINQGRAGAVPPYDQAYGGNTIKRVGNFWVHTFTSSGTFTPVSDGSVDYLVIAGGGGGGGIRGGGGGAGGYRSSWNSEASGGGGSSETALNLTAGTDYTVTIGAGGNGGLVSVVGTGGGNSVFSSITSIGGGFVGPADNNAGNGGSGGGASRSNVSAGTGTSNQGFAGGAGGTYVSAHAGSGGGGAKEIGVEGNGAGVGGAGGDGVASTISGSSIVRGGGGGGGVHTTNNGLGAGGAGGGGNATASGNGQAGTANTGGGGGATSYTSSYASQYGGAGGSGIVIIRYAIG